MTGANIITNLARIKATNTNEEFWAVYHSLSEKEQEEVAEVVTKTWERIMATMRKLLAALPEDVRETFLEEVRSDG